MRVPVSWLRDFAPFGSAESLVPVLDDLGLVVEGVEQVGASLEEIVVAHVKEVSAIPGADRIRRVVVDAGDGDLQIVCGAWNFGVGDLVPLARVGAVLPGGMEIGRRKMKGVASEGMLCSGKELGLSSDADGLLVLGDDSSGAPRFAPGMPLTEALGIERDTVLDIAVETNRPDALCMAGIARDLAAKLHLGFSLPDPPEPVLGAAPDREAFAAHVEIPDADLCPRFTACVLSGFEIGPSPSLIASRLVLAGMRPLNNVVDASNYVMLELGQPTHPYDLERVARHTLRARAAHRGESVETLDGVERKLGERRVGPGDDMRDCVICDGDDVAIGIGGVMGGATSEISELTRAVLLEAAYFAPMSIARTSARLGLRTEASIRFERGCDPLGIDRSVNRLFEVLAMTAGPDFAMTGERIDVRGEVPRPVQISVRTKRLNKILGSELDDAQIAGYLDPIGFPSRQGGPGVLDVTVPTFRPDATREIDVIEEVARHHGYQSIPRRTPKPPQVGGLADRQRERRRLRESLAHFGAHESWTPSLLAPGDHERIGLGSAGIVVSNPLSPEESVLRRSLMPGLLRALVFNANRRQSQIRLFEVGNVFAAPDAERLAAAMAHTDPTLSVAVERELAALLMAGPGDDARSATAAWKVVMDAIGFEGVDVVQRLSDDPAGDKDPGEGQVGWGAGLHPTRSATLVVSKGSGFGAVVGEVGEIDPEVLDSFGVDPSRGRVGWLQFDFGEIRAIGPRRSMTVAAVSRYPSTDIDLSFTVPNGVPASAVEETLRQSGAPLLEKVWLFDVFRTTGTTDGPSLERSLAYRLRFCAQDRTLTDAEVAELRSVCIASVEREHGARIRS